MKKELNRKRDHVHALHLVLPRHSSWDDWMTEVRALLRHLASFFKKGAKRRSKHRRSKRTAKQFKAQRVPRNLSVSEKIALGQRVYHHLVNNPDFASVTPSPDVLIAVISDMVEAHYDAVNESSAVNHELLRSKVKVFDAVFNLILHSVDEIAHGRESVYRSAGIEAKRK